MKNNIHCGACMKDFDNMNELSQHLENCWAAKTILPLVNKIWFLKGDKTGHPLSHFIMLLKKNIHLIQRYYCSISDKTNDLERAKIHFELCNKLSLDYNKFRPFESEKITLVPNRKQAEEILWRAIQNEIEKMESQP
jgi:hypothetical protein